MNDTIRFKQAVSFMSEAHRSINQRRKYSGAPYEVHPLGVTVIVETVTADEDIRIGALFHDIIEDVFPENPKYDMFLIGNLYGEQVAKYVTELTDVYTKEAWPDLNRARRKQNERERYAKMSPGAKLVKIADIFYNVNDTVVEDPGFARMFIKEKVLCLPYLAPNEKDGALYAQIRELHERAKEKIAQKCKEFDIH